ncbi:MAG: YceI family protein [Rhodothermales bacterium]|nr:YceI family protein [Rhodothermales bacterium]
MTRLATLSLAFCLTTAAMAQDTQVYTVQDGSVLEIDGTSNKSDWTVSAAEMSGTFEMTEGAVTSARFAVVSNSIRGSHGVIQNKLITKALKIGSNPEVVYTLTEVTGSEAVEGGTQLSTKGTLSLAGVDREIEMDVMISDVEGGVRFVGEHPVSMTDYRIKPPTAMFGALHVGKEVLVRFDVTAAPAEEAGTD